MAKNSKKASQSLLFEQLVLQTVFKEDDYRYPFLLRKKNAVQDQPTKNLFTGQLIYNDPIQNNDSQLSPNHFGKEEEKELKKSDYEDFCWWRPPTHSIFTKYLENSSMHGLKYIAQGRRHISERIFWALMFIISLAMATYLINQLWRNFRTNPVNVSFNPKEIKIDMIPFPAVTICSMDIISKDIINQLNVRANKQGNDPLAVKARNELQYANSICKTSTSFSKTHKFAASRGSIKFDFFNDSQSNESLYVDKFLLKRTPPCHEMIRRCMWSQKIVDCRKIFTPVLSDMGKCCTFNMLPSSLLLTSSMNAEQDETPKNKSAINSLPRRVRERIRENKIWQKWNYLNGFILSPEIKLPRSQKRAGAPFGLSLLLDGNTQRYFCPSTDSEGFRLLFHTPLEFPQVKDFGLAIGLEQEIFVGLLPKLTMAANIRHYSSRGCIFEDEMNLTFFQPYAYKNCALECAAKIIEKNCSCVNYEMPRLPDTKICSTDPDEYQQKCVYETKKELNRNFRQFCGECKSLCSELWYKPELNRADLQSNSILWFDHGEQMDRPPDWYAKKLSLVHIFFKTDEFVPSLRRELYAVTDLIASTGNILCLCLGFSVLSVVELIYFFTYRLYWKQIRKGNQDKNLATTSTSTSVESKSTVHNNANGQQREDIELQFLMTHELTNIRVRPNNTKNIHQNIHVPFKIYNSDTSLNTYGTNDQRFVEFGQGHLKQY